MTTTPFPRTMRHALQFVVITGACVVGAQQPAPPPPAQPAWVAVKPIDPPASPFPAEAASSQVTRFSFIAYGDTRSSGIADVVGDGDIIQPEHNRLMDRMLATIRERASTSVPVRFVLQSGDAVLRGQSAAMWNVSYTPIIERLTHSANIPVFLTAGNHDVTTLPASEPARSLALHNTLTAMSRMIPPEGSPRRLAGYLTYAFGYGNTFLVTFDSNIASDPIQLSWVTNQLEHLDRRRYPNVIVFFHHPVYSSGPHSGASADPVPGTGQKAADRVEPQTTAIRASYLPLFRKHHVKLLITGHDHLYDHWVEHYVDNGNTYRMDQIVTGGGGAPIYTYAGEPTLGPYTNANADRQLRLDHLTKPGATLDENPHHFVIVQVDGDRLSLEIVPIGPAAFTPYGGSAKKILLDTPASNGSR